MSIGRTGELQEQGASRERTVAGTATSGQWRATQSPSHTRGSEQRRRAQECGDGHAGLRSRHSGRRTVLRCSVLALAHSEHWASRAGRESQITAGRWTRKSRLSESVNFLNAEAEGASPRGKSSRYETYLQRPDGSSGESDRFHAVRTTNSGFTFGPAGNRRLRRISAETRRGAFLNPNSRTRTSPYRIIAR